VSFGPGNSKSKQGLRFKPKALQGENEAVVMSDMVDWLTSSFNTVSGQVFL